MSGTLSRKLGTRPVEAVIEDEFFALARETFRKRGLLVHEVRFAWLDRERSTNGEAYELHSAQLLTTKDRSDE